MNQQEMRRQKKLSKRTRRGQVPSSDLRLKNLAAFNEFLPGLFHELAAYKPRGRLVEVEGGDHDVELEGNCLYGGHGAQKFARQQLDAYWRQPKRVSMGAVDSVSLDAHSNLFGTQLVTRAVDSGMTFRVDIVTDESYFLVVLGVGLAPHVAELAHRTGCHYLILVETDLECFYHSTTVFDWRALLAEFSGDKTLDIIVSDNAQDISNIVQRAVFNANCFGVEGMYWFDHYSNEIFRDAFADFLKNLRPPLAGFFTDEFYMISQSHENIRGGTSRVVAKKYDKTTVPVFIVGTGPSLDAVLPVLKANQANAVIMACGTALEPLLLNGIRPDFLIHLERDAIILDNHQIFSRDYDFSDVCLIAASNLYPGVADFHDSTVFFCRPAISSGPIFAREAHLALSQPDPLVANSALAFAHRAGFRNIYFFGVDMGTKDPERSHSKDSAYTTRNMESPYNFEYEAPGNFGGTAFADVFLTLSRKRVEQLIIDCGAGYRHYNCSDGALIAGAEPTDPTTVSLPKFESKRDVVKRIVEFSPIYEREEFDLTWAEWKLAERIPAYCDELTAWASGFDPFNPTSVTSLIKLSKFPLNDDPVAMMFRGSIFQGLLVVGYLAPRVATNQERDTFKMIVREEFTNIIDHMKQDALGLVVALEAGETPRLTIEPI